MENEDILFKKYEILIKARNFHYENYNKWMTYFYVAIGALFVAFYTIAQEEKNKLENKFFLEICVLVVGYIASMLWYWSAKGYYYWNINFITLVNYYETELLKWPEKERVYKVFANKSEQNNYVNPIMGANISTSKVAILFAFIITCFWGFILFHFLFELKAIPACGNVVFSIVSTLTLTLILSSLIPKNCLQSNIKGFPDLKLKDNEQES